MLLMQTFSAVPRLTPANGRYPQTKLPVGIYSVEKHSFLDMRPTEIKRAFGMAWGVGGWLVFPYLQKIGAEATQRLRTRVAAEIKTTFASNYSKIVSLQEALQLPNIAAYSKRATGEKFLIAPHKSS